LKYTHRPAQFDVRLLILLEVVRDTRAYSDRFRGFISGRNTENWESREYGFPTFLDVDFDELRSEVAFLVAAAK